MQLHEMFNRPAQAEILGLLAESHYRAAMNNDNTSSAVAVATFAASGCLTRAIAAASLSQGGLHAPIAQARRMFRFKSPYNAAKHFVDNGERVPGFGNSFYKDRIDPAFSDLYQALPEDQRDSIAAIQLAVPKLYPNAALITGAVCEATDLPPGVESMIFTYCRIPAWTKLCLARKLPKVGTP